MRRRIGILLVALAILTLSVGLYGAHISQPLHESPLEPYIGELTPSPDAAAADALLYAQALERLEERLVRYPNDLEAQLFKGLIQFKAGRPDQALEALDRLVAAAPTFHLAHLVRGDLLLAQTHAVEGIGGGLLSVTSGEESARLASLRDEAEVRVNAFLDSLPSDRLPQGLLLLDETVSTALVVDKRAHRLYIYRRGHDGVPVLAQDFYVSLGRLVGNKVVEGDLKTPEGVYFVTRHIPGSRLPDLYGSGAYPVNYPNELDRWLGKTGHGIWLHGTESGFYSRPPLDSEGCVVLPNLDLTALGDFIEPGSTPVIISDTVTWLEKGEWRALRGELVAAIEAWRADWEGGDVAAYLSHYDEAFWTPRHTLESWSRYKRQVAQGKLWQSVELSELSLFFYPASASDGRTLAVANFRQTYNSNNFSSSVSKRLYLNRGEDGRWRVIYEGLQR